MMRRRHQLFNIVTYRDVEKCLSINSLYFLISVYLAQGNHMKVIAIPGKVPATKTWIREVVDAAKIPSLDLYVHSFTAWQHPEVDFNLVAELPHMPKANCDVVVAKSIGTLASLKSPNLEANHVIFIGVALSLYSESDKQLLQEMAVSKPMLVIQQTADPFGTFAELQELLGQHATCVEVAGNDHLYNDVDELGRIIHGWLA